MAHAHFLFVDETQSPYKVPPWINFDFIFSFVGLQLLLVLLFQGGAKYEMSGYQVWLSLAVVRLDEGVCRQTYP